MKNLNRILLTTGLVVLAIAANAQEKGRSFSYNSADTVDSDFSAAGDVDLKARTTIKVNPYLYISGNFGAEWVVDGWGTGIDTRVESIKFFHNETLTLDLELFDNPKKVSGTKTGDQSVLLAGQLQFVNEATGRDLYDSGMVPIAELNKAFNPSGPHFEVGYTGGLLKLNFGRKITIRPEVGPGTYENVGVIKVIRN